MHGLNNNKSQSNTSHGAYGKKALITNMDVQTKAPTSNIVTDNWRDWNPGLDNNELTLRSVYDTLPGAGPDEIDQMVRLLENPASPYALPGAVRLRHHDYIHILLGRGLLNQDEAFVIGYTMGTARDHINDEQVQLFRLAAKLLYKPPYRMTDNDLIAFDLAFALGNGSQHRHIYKFDFDRALDLDIGDIRKELGIDIKALKAGFREERLLLPGNKASERLPVI
jgi:hypothetical protein